MFFNIGDLVTRNSYNNDTLFKITNIEKDKVYLKGVDVRLYADSEISDLKKHNDKLINNDEEYERTINNSINLDRSSYFYIPGKVLHIDGDEDYLNRCIKFYNKMNIKSYGLLLKESDISSKIVKYLNDLKPDIVVITGHDFYYKNRNDISDLNNYKNSKNFVEAIKKAREYEHSQEKLIIVAGACQSNYEELIKAGANFASSPKRVNIHALDPAVIATSVALSPKNEIFDLIDIISRTKNKEEGYGGIITNGVMYTGYPR